MDTLLDQYDLILNGMWALKRLGYDRDTALGAVYLLHDTITEQLSGEPTRHTRRHCPSDEAALLERVGLAYRRFVAAEAFALAHGTLGGAFVSDHAKSLLDAANAFLRETHRRRQSEDRSKDSSYTEDDAFVPLTLDGLRPALDNESDHHLTRGLRLDEWAA